MAWWHGRPASILPPYKRVLSFHDLVSKRKYYLSKKPSLSDCCIRCGVHRSRFACCLDDHDHNSLHEQTARVQCIFIEDYFSEAVAYEGTAAEKVGTFTATW